MLNGVHGGIASVPEELLNEDRPVLRHKAAARDTTPNHAHTLGELLDARSDLVWHVLVIQRHWNPHDIVLPVSSLVEPEWCREVREDGIFESVLPR